MTKGTTHTLLIGLCLLGLAASVGSAYVHYRLINDPSYTSFCDISSTLNCESVYRSQFGTVAGVPVAVGGLLWFGFVLLLLLFAGNATQPAPAPTPRAKGRVPTPSSSGESPVSGYLFVLSTIALAVVLYLAYASFFILKTACILCIATYVAVIGIFLVSGAAGPERLGALPGAAARDLRRLVRSPVALTIAILYLAGAASAIAFFPREDGATRTEVQTTAAAPVQSLTAAQAAEFEKWLAAQPRVPIAEPTDGAKVLILKFNDYQCPPCRQTYNEYKPILAKYQGAYPGQVKFVTKDFPLEAECNTGGVHAAACEAAAAVRMARMKNKADALEAWLFDNQPAMSPELVRRGVREVGGVSDFEAQYPRLLDQVRADVALGRQLGVGSTPTFFINGVKIVGGLKPGAFDHAIAYELKRAGAGAEKP